MPVNAHGNIDRFCKSPARARSQGHEYECLLLLVEVFMKVMNGLVITLEEDKRFFCVWLFYYVSNFADNFANGGARISIKFYFMRSFFCLSVFSSCEVLGKITSIQSKLQTAACWSREGKGGNCDANLL